MLGDPQIHRGYCLLLRNPWSPTSTHWPAIARRQFLDDMAALGDAVLVVRHGSEPSQRILGNVRARPACARDSRHASEDPELRKKPVWLHDWSAAPAVAPRRSRSRR